MRRPSKFEAPRSKSKKIKSTGGMQDDNNDMKQAATSSATVTLPDIGGHSSVMQRELGSAKKEERIKGGSALFNGFLRELQYEPVNHRGMPTTGIEKVRQPGQSKADFERKRLQRCAEQAAYDRVANLGPEQRRVAFGEMLEMTRRHEREAGVNEYTDAVCDLGEQRVVTVGAIMAADAAVAREEPRIQKMLCDLAALLPTQFALGYDFPTGSYQVKPDTMGAMVDLVDHLSGVQVLEFVERVSDEGTREIALRKDVVGALQLRAATNS